MCDATGLSQRRACWLTGLSLSTCRYDAQRPAADAHLSGRIPERKIVQAGDKFEISLTVSKAKYGLDHVNWMVDPALTANGGSYSVHSSTLPPYIFSGKSRQAQEYNIAAVGTDTHGNESNTAVMVLAVTPSTSVIAALTLSPENGTQPADDKQVYTTTATVRNHNGMPLSDQELTFSIRGLETQAGKKGATLEALKPSASTKRHSRAGEVTVATGLRLINVPV